MDVKEIREAEICCGSAGIYNMVEPEPAEELGKRKAQNILDTGAEMIVTSNPGCMLQIQASSRRWATPNCRPPTRWRSSTPLSAASR